MESCAQALPAANWRNAMVQFYEISPVLGIVQR